MLDRNKHNDVSCGGADEYQLKGCCKVFLGKQNFAKNITLYCIEHIFEKSVTFDCISLLLNYIIVRISCLVFIRTYQCIEIQNQKKTEKERKEFKPEATKNMR